MIIAIFSIAQLIFAPINGTIKNFLGAKNAIIIGFSILTVTTFGLGAVIHIKNPFYFKYTANALRFMQGQGDTLLQITGYSVITSTFSSEMLKYIGYIEICVGVGLGLGPLLSSLVFSALAYEYTMYLFGLLNVAGTILCICCLPGELNITLTDEEQAMVDEEIDGLDEKTKNKRIQVTWGSVFFSKTIMLCLFACFVGTVNLQFWTGYLATVFFDLFEIEEDVFGYIIAS